MIGFLTGLACGTVTTFVIHKLWIGAVLPVLRSGDVILCDDPDCALGMLDGELHCEVCLDPEKRA